MNRMPESSTASTYVPLRRRRTRRVHVVPNHLLLVLGVWLACVVSAVLILQDHHRQVRPHLAREAVAPAPETGKSSDTLVELHWGDGGRLYPDSLLQRVADASPTTPR